MGVQYGFDVRIETRQDGDGWWGLIYLFSYDPNETPLLVGPCEDEESAVKRANLLARDIAAQH